MKEQQRVGLCEHTMRLWQQGERTGKYIVRRAINNTHADFCRNIL